MKRITSLLLLLLIVLTFSSCVHKTLREASKGINPPVYTTLKETRYRLISEEREKAEKEAEEKRVAEENARLEAEERLSNHEYPENLDDLGYPHLYTPSKSASTLNEDKTFTVILLPLGDFTLDEKTLSYINNTVSLFDAGIIALTGSLENQINFSKLYQNDAVTLSGGTVIHTFPVKEAKPNFALLSLNSEDTLGISVYDMGPFLPSNQEEFSSAMKNLEDEQTRLTDNTLMYVKDLDSPALFFLSSLSPVSEDWTEFTPFPYRYKTSFAIGQTLQSRGWNDVFDLVRYSVETDPGITRKNDNFAERLDFIYEKGLFVKSSQVLAIQGLSDRLGISAVVAEFILN